MSYNNYENNNEEILKAIDNDNVNYLINLYKNGILIEENFYDYDMLSDAAKKGRIKCLKYLIEIGFSHRCLIVDAIRNEHIECVEYLCKNILLHNYDAISAAIVAVEIGQTKYIKLLIKYKCTIPNNIIMYTAKNGDIECAKYLRKQGYPWGKYTIRDALEYRPENAIEYIRYVIDNGCRARLNICRILFDGCELTTSLTRCICNNCKKNVNIKKNVYIECVPTDLLNLIREFTCEF